MRFTAGTTPSVDVIDRPFRRVGEVTGVAPTDSFADIITRQEWLQHLRAGRAFANVVSQAAAAGQFAEVELRNPAGSAIRMLIYGLILESSPAMTVGVLVGGSLSAGGVQGVNLRSGSAASVGIRAGRSVAAVQAENIALLRTGTANLFLPGSAGWLAEIPLGEAITVSGRTAAQLLSVAFLWAEV